MFYKRLKISDYYYKHSSNSANIVPRPNQHILQNMLFKLMIERTKEGCNFKLFPFDYNIVNVIESDQERLSSRHEKEDLHM